MKETRYRLRALPSEGHSRDLAVKDQLAIHHPLAMRDESSSIEFHQARQEIEGVAWDHLAPEAHLVAAGETKEPLHAPTLGVQKAG